MKKFAYGILSVLLLFGGVFFAACKPKPVEISVSADEVTIYTNNQNAEHNKEATIDVSLTNSSAGVYVEVIEGNDCVHTPSFAIHKDGGEYYFAITADKSGEATVRVSAVDDIKQHKEIKVYVNTIVESLGAVKDDTTNSRSNLFVVKGESEGKTLVADNLFDFQPVTANIKDVIWAFENGEQQFMQNGVEAARIEDGRLYVFENFLSDKITLTASMAYNTAISSAVTFEVLENSTVNALTLDGYTGQSWGEVELISNGEVKVSDAKFLLKRNDATKSSVTGKVVFNTKYDVSLTPVFFEKATSRELSQEEFSQIFKFNVLGKEVDAFENKVTYTFAVDALDENAAKRFGEFNFALRAGYENFNFDIETTDVIEIALDTSYAVEGVELVSDDGIVLNNTIVDVFSNYASGFGYGVRTLLEPTDVAVDNNLYYISVDVNDLAGWQDGSDVSDYFKFYIRGREINFSAALPNGVGQDDGFEVGGSLRYSALIQSGTDLAVSAVLLQEKNLPAMLSGIKINFVPVSDPTKATTLTMNLFRVSTGGTLIVTDENGNALEDRFLSSSSQSSNRSETYRVKIDGISALAGQSAVSGLEIKTDGNQRFSFSSLKNVTPENLGANDNYVVVEFTVTLVGSDFDASTTFWFEHVTGKTSATTPIKLEAFVPLTSASISLSNADAANVYINKSQQQDFVVTKDGLIEHGASSGTSITHLLAEAGVTLPLNVNYQSISKENAVFKFMTYADFVSTLKTLDEFSGLSDEELAVEAERLFNSDEWLNLVDRLYGNNFKDFAGVPFAISSNRLDLADLPAKGIVCATFTGFTETHEEFSIARFFALESFYAVNMLSSDVKEKLLYTTETLSESDMARSYVDITVTFRVDQKVATYLDSLSYFTFASANAPFTQEYVGNAVESVLKNDFYQISNIRFVSSGRYLRFTVTANSTNLQRAFDDTLTISYFDGRAITKRTDIQIEIKNVARVENVDWVNKNVDGEIYLNLTSDNREERTAVISTSVSPAEANDKALGYVYVPTTGGASNLAIGTTLAGQSFNLSIDDRLQVGGTGYLYILPQDMIKKVDNIDQILVYRSSGNGMVADYVALSDIGRVYDDLVGTYESSDEDGQYLNYFINNNEEKVLNKNIILKIKITIADGLSQSTAIRIYNSSELARINTANYYQIMNNLTLTDWQSIETFSGMIFAETNVVLSMTGDSDMFIKNNRGTLQNLTFSGRVSSQQTSVGFVVGSNSGTLENIVVDVASANNSHSSSLLSATAKTAENNESLFVGGIAGQNNGTIKNSAVYGLSVVANQFEGDVYAGGLVGKNSGLVEGCSVEFYDFVDGTGVVVPNTIEVTSGGAVGGIVGYAASSSTISKSYVYAYPLGSGQSHDHDYIIKNGNGIDGLFMAVNENGAKASESFAFMGDLMTPTNSAVGNDYAVFENVYLTYFNGSNVRSRIFENSKFRYVANSDSYIYSYESNFKDSVILGASDIPSNGQSLNASSIWATLDENIWEVGQISNNIWTTGSLNADINFGFMYLKNVAQSLPVDVSTLGVNDVELGGYQQAIDVGETLKNGQVVGRGMLFHFETTASGLSAVEQSQLDRLNTISFVDLFGVTEKEARSLLVTTTSSNVRVGTSGLQVLSANASAFTLTVRSKMDFTQSKDFEFVVLDNLPSLTTTVAGASLSDGQTVRLQKGKTLDISHNLNYTIYLDGNAYQTTKGAYSIDYAFVDGNDDGVSVTKSGNLLIIFGNENDAFCRINSFITSTTLDADYAKALQGKRTRNFSVSVFNGATELYVLNASNVSFKTSEHATIDVLLTTDNDEDNLTFTLAYNEREWSANVDKDTTATSFVVDSKLTLEVSWAKLDVSEDLKQTRYRVTVQVGAENRHLIDEDYDGLKLSINALSRQDSTNLQKTVEIGVKAQNIEDISIQVYSIASRNIRNSLMYYSVSSNIINTITPASDAIVAVAVSPAYSKMSYFTITYQGADANSALGAVSISKLAYNDFGFYISSSNTTVLTNGLRVTLTEQDKRGDGIFYFRIYASTTFADSSDLKFIVTFYDGEIVQRSSSIDLKVSYLKEATIKLGEGNGVTNYLLAKGDSVKVTVTIRKEQTLYGLYLQNQGLNIDLSSWTETESGDNKIYTAYVTAHVDATSKDGTGNIYVCADVESVVNGVQEIKTSKASISLVDFSLGVTTQDNKVTSGISVKSSGTTSTYNGNTYDVFYSYVGAIDTLEFDYTLLPEEYNYNSADPEEVAAVRAIEAEKQKFLRNYNYTNNAGYYINYKFDEDYGVFRELSLKQQLSFATDESHSSTIYNENYDFITQSDYFGISEVETSAGNAIKITGKKTGRQLMKLTTTVIYQGIEFVYDYYFLIVVELWSDEDTPTIITSGQEFVDYATNSELPDDYILMNDIVLDDYTPLSTSLIKSLDGNGFTIHLNSFAKQDGNTLRLALFDRVLSGTTLKNVRVNVYGAGQIEVDVTQKTNIQIAGFALQNDGVIYNCEVVSYKSEHQTVSHNVNGIVVNYVKGAGTDPVEMNDSYVGDRISSTVAGFVVENNTSIINSRVGGESFKQVVSIAGQTYLQTQTLDVFTIQGQMSVVGFVETNSGNISACFAKNVDIFNKFDSTLSLSAGFVLNNESTIQNSYVEGKFLQNESDPMIATGTRISSMGYVGGFVYSNGGIIKNSYSNISIDNQNNKPSYAAGFVYENQSGAEISLCYTASSINTNDINQMRFAGVDDLSNPLNYGTITNSYYYTPEVLDTTKQSLMVSGVTAVHNLRTSPEDSLYGFSFSSGEEMYDGIWEKTEHGISLVSANRIAVSNRYSVTGTNGVISIFYNKTLMDSKTLLSEDYSYGSQNNPIIIRDAYDFAMATGKASTKEISAYKEYYTDTAVRGTYRLVNDIVMSEIDQNAVSDNSVKLTTTKKTFYGILDGNGFTISDIQLMSSDADDWSYGLFAKLDSAVVMNADLIVTSVSNAQARAVGTLAGIAVDSRIVAISLSPSSMNDDEATSLLGFNVVGGVVGMLFGDSVMSDVNVNNINITSSYNGGTVTVGKNENVLSTFRNIVANGGNLSGAAARVSYVGAVAGFVDVYNPTSVDYVKFSSTLQISNYDIMNVHAAGNINLYGEVAGGLFGYVGKNTYIFDATLKVEEPSYIIAKNMYAGGLIGENYGGLFAVSASYTDEEDLQKNIEGQQHNYYASGTAQYRGQMDIFSRKVHETDNPLYIGGLVGLMGGGFVHTAYSKLNVVSDFESTIAVGGIIGRVDYTETAYPLDYVHDMPTVNILLNDVYASGDLYSTSGFSGGIVGALGYDYLTPVLGLKNIVAANYYSYNENGLLGDTTTFSENTTLSDNHFALVGKIVDKSGQVREILNSSLYIISDLSYAYNYATNEDLSGASTGSKTVGGYVEIALQGKTIQINPFGFEVPWINRTDENYRKTVFEKILEVEHIGGESFATTASAYVHMSTYFLKNSWDEKYWVHTQDDLFPHIELVPKDNYIFWDANDESTKQVLMAMSLNPGLTVIVRGKVDSNNDNSNSYADIDLTNYPDFEPIVGFHGTLISFRSYFGTNLGYVNTWAGNYYGAKNDGRSVDPGLIISKSLFENLGDGAMIEGLNIYFTSSNNSTIDYSLVKNSVNEVTFKDLNLVLNHNVSLSAQEAELTDTSERIAAAGLITYAAYATSFLDNTITLRRNGSSLVKIEMFNRTMQENDSYFGLYAGYVEQNSRKTVIAVRGLKVVDETTLTSSGNTTPNMMDITFESAGAGEVYAGLMTGAIRKTGNASKVSTTISRIDNVLLNIVGSDNSNATAEAIYVGGFVGKAEGVTETTLENGVTDDGNGISIIQDLSTKQLYAGLAFGQVASGMNIASDASTSVSKLAGAFYQGAESTIGKAQIGGIAGNATGNIAIQGFGIDFTIAKMKKEENTIVATTPVYVDENKIHDFDINNFAYVLSPLQLQESSLDNSMGGLFGYAQNVDITLSGGITVSGTIDVAVNSGFEANGQNTASVVNVGGMIGKLLGSIESNMVSTNTTNISVSEFGVNNTREFKSTAANIGGMIGWFTTSTNAADGTSTSRGTISNSVDTIGFDGNVISNLAALRFGGVIGLVSNNAQFTISNFVYGGALKVWGSHTDGGEVYAGGIVGEKEVQTETSDVKNTISNCLTFGDVFVIYNGNENADSMLSSYYFGGILGKGNATKIEKCSTIMTNFNSRTTKGYSNEHVGSIVGGNDGVTFENNKYSSVVNLAYQVEDLTGENKTQQNSDCPYGADVAYLGYSNSTSNANTTSSNILDDFAAFAGQTGSKLNPFVLKNDANEDVDTSKLSNTHGISWVALGDLEFSKTYKTTGSETSENNEALFDNMTNIAFVGNGQSFKVTDERNSNAAANNRTTNGYYLGGIANTMGKGYGGDSTSGNIPMSSNPNFNVISGVQLNLSVLADVNGTEANRAYNYGGVAGSTFGNSIIYAVGVTGDISVGGANKSNENNITGSDLRLGGIVGFMQGGKIEESFTNAAITYRAGDSGRVAGIANVAGSFNNAIVSSYSSGQIETYVDASIFTFASIIGGKNATEIARDSYSITQTKVSLVDVDVTKSSNKAINFIGGGTDNATFTTNNVLNGCYGVADDLKTSGTMALSYGGTSNNETSTRNNSLSSGNTTDNTINPWYFNPYCNYGYATHGFGFLKNVTTYTRALTNASVLSKTSGGDKEEDFESVVPEYEYKVVPYLNALSFTDELKSGNDECYLGINNAGKLQQMIETVKAAGYNKKYRFVLDFDINMKQFDGTYGSSIGVKDKGFVLDGRNHTLDFSYTQTTFVQNGNTYSEKSGAMSEALFGTVNGTIENLRLGNINVNGARGTLAKTLTGDLLNVTVIGNLTTNATTAGGVVGTLNGNAKAVEGAVNVTASYGGIAGGLFGEVNGGLISYSSNSGQVVLTAGISSGLRFKVITSGGNVSANELDDANAVAGGIVGYANGVTIDNSYNANAVLANYTSQDDCNNIAGGIAGYLQNSSIKSSYNTGLVGAGNYGASGSKRSNGFSFAGGIVGYAVGGQSSIQDCQNDGKVEAIGKMPDTPKEEVDYMFEVKRINGEASTSRFTNDPDKLTIDVELIYNPKKARQVYAYGIGFMADGSVSNCKTSTDNIKNDGCIGEVSGGTETMTFDRKTVLDTDEINYWGRFHLKGEYNSDQIFDPTLYENAYDSYGFPTRVYGIDTITRAYMRSGWDYPGDVFLVPAGTNSSGDPVYSPFNNDIYWAYKNSQQDKVSGIEARGYPNYEGVYNIANGRITSVSEQTDAKYYGRDNWTNAKFNNSWECFAMPQSTDYYASVSFESYDELLAKENGKLSNKSSGEATGNETSDESEVNKNIAGIDAKTESNLKLIDLTINGKESAIVWSANNLKAVVAPCRYEGEVTFPIDARAQGKITKDNFKVEHANAIVQIFDIDIVKETDRQVSVKFTAYMAAKVDANKFNVTFDFTYSDNITLGMNNVFVKDGFTYVVLQDANGTILNKETIDEINSSAKDKEYVLAAAGTGDLQYDENGYAYGVENAFAGAEIGWWNGNSPIEGIDNVGYVRLQGNQSTALTDGDRFYVVVNERRVVESDVVLYVETDKKTANFTVSDYTYPGSAGNWSLTFDGFEKTTIDALMSVNFETISANERRIDLTALESASNGKLAFGASGFGINYTAVDGWNITNSRINGVVLSIVNEDGKNYLHVAVDTSATSPSVDDVETFIKGFGSFDAYRNKLSTDIRYEWNGAGSNPLIQNSTQTVSETQSGIRLTTIYAIAQTGNFNTDGTYGGANFDGENGDYITTASTSVFGLDFYTKVVKYNYNVSSATYTTTGDKLGYSLSYTSTSGNSFFQQGALTDANKSMSIEGVNAGDKLAFEIFKNTFKDDSGEDGKYSSLQRVITLINKIDENDEPIQYTFTTGEDLFEDFEIDDLASAIQYLKGVEYYETLYSVDNGELYDYSYKVFADGTISVEVSVDGNAQEMYIYKENTLYKVATTTETITDDDTNYTITSFDYSKVDVGDKQRFDALLAGFKLVVSYFDDTTIMFAKNDVDASVYDLRVNGVIDEAYYEGHPYNITLIDDDSLTTSFDVNTIKDALERGTEPGTSITISATNRYRSSGESAWTNGAQINNNNIGKYTYNWESVIEMSQTAEAKLQEGTASTRDYAYVVLADDIHMDTNIGGGSVAYYGDGHILKYVSNDSTSISYLKEKSGDISNMTLVGIASLRNANTSIDYAMVSSAQQESVNYKDLNLYGSMRNIKADAKATIYPVVTAQVGTDALSNVKSYISMVGLDGVNGQSYANNNNDLDGESVSTILRDKVDSKSSTSSVAISDFASHNIVVAGNGGQGGNGKDRVHSDDDLGKNYQEGIISAQTAYSLQDILKGQNGGNGGNGGQVEVSNHMSGAFTRAGVGGNGGNGGNGANGWYIHIGVGSVSGGNGGNAGKTGQTPSESDTSTRTLANNSYSGNGGIGGFGKVINDFYYPSAVSGGGGEYGASIRWKQGRDDRYDNNANTITFGRVGNVFNSFAEDTWAEHKERKNWAATDVPNFVKGATVDYKGDGTLYISSRLALFFGIKFTHRQSTTVVWMDEGMNYGGEFERGVPSYFKKINIDANGGNAPTSIYLNTANNKFYNTETLAEISLASAFTREHYSFAGLYSGSKQVVDENGKLLSNISGFTDADGKWIYNDAGGGLSLTVNWKVSAAYEVAAVTINIRYGGVTARVTITKSDGTQQTYENSLTLYFRHGSNDVYLSREDALSGQNAISHMRGYNMQGNLSGIARGFSYNGVMVLNGDGYQGGILRSNVSYDGVQITDASGNWVYASNSQLTLNFESML